MLSGNDLEKKADKAILMYSEVFDALEEYDKTKRLKKISHKTRANFTIDSNLMARFREHCSKNGIKMSSKVEGLIEKEIANKG